MMYQRLTTLVSLLSFASFVQADVPAPVPLSSAFVSSSGVFPALTVTADTAPTGPNITSPRSECGVGAMMAWADKLYVVSYLSVPNAGSGTGLYAIDANLQMTKLANHSSVYANRMMVPAMNVIVIGPYIIDSQGNIQVLQDLLHVRIGGMAEHILYPDSMVYMLGMDGPLWECNLLNLSCTQLFDLTVTLQIPFASGEQQHFKAAHTMNGTLWVAENCFEEADGLGLQHGGRLATWDGNMDHNWTILETTAFFEVTGRHNMGRTVFALGWDAKSVILKVLDNGALNDQSYDTLIQTFRLPKATNAYNHLWTTEWPRIREVETERYLMNAHAMWYELTPFTWGGAVSIRPISTHLRMVPDYASFRGFLVLGGNQVSSIFDNNWVTGESQSGLWFGKTDDLWNFGKPTGWGGVWQNELVLANTPSDPYLMTGFDKKVIHFRADPPFTSGDITVTVQIDFTGSAGHIGPNFVLEPFNNLTTITLSSSKPYAYYTFDQGFSAHWVRFTTDNDCNCTVVLHYT